MKGQSGTEHWRRKESFGVSFSISNISFSKFPLIHTHTASYRDSPPTYIFFFCWILGYQSLPLTSVTSPALGYVGEPKLVFPNEKPLNFKFANITTRGQDDIICTAMLSLFFTSSVALKKKGLILN